MNASTSVPGHPGADEPTNLVVTSRTTNGIVLSWTAATDDVGVSRYGLYRNSGEVATTTGTSGIFSGLACGTAYILGVDAQDAAGNRSLASTLMVSTTACPDTSAPTAPSGLAAGGIGQTGLTLTWNASSDDVAVTGYDVYRDGVKVATVTPPSSAQAGLSCGTSYAFRVIARDAAGNSSPPADLSASTAACSPPPPAGGTVYHVATTGSDATGDGSAAKPWKTIAKACATVAAGAGSTIQVGAGTYVESATCLASVRHEPRGRGWTRRADDRAGLGRPPRRRPNCTAAGNTQTVSGLKLDGQHRSAGTRGMTVSSVRGLTVTDLDAENFKGARAGQNGGGALNVVNAWNLDLGNSTLRNGGDVQSSQCTGTLGLGDFYDSRIHDLTISEDVGYGVKGSVAPSEVDNTTFDNLDVSVGTTSCSVWNTLAFELFETNAVGTTIENSSFNATVSLTDVGSGPGPLVRLSLRRPQQPLDDQHRQRVRARARPEQRPHPQQLLAGGLYPVANFTSQVKSGNVIDHNVFDNVQVHCRPPHHVGDGVGDLPEEHRRDAAELLDLRRVLPRRRHRQPEQHDRGSRQHLLLDRPRRRGPRLRPEQRNRRPQRLRQHDRQGHERRLGRHAAADRRLPRRLHAGGSSPAGVGAFSDGTWSAGAS